MDTEAPAKGLSSVPQPAAPSGADVLAPRKGQLPTFPGTELVASAAALFHNSPWLLQPGRRGEVVGAEGRMFRVLISPGTVGVAVRDPARLERNRQTGLGHDPANLPGMVGGFAHDDPQWGPVRRASAWAPGQEGAASGTWQAGPDDPEDPWFREALPARQVEGWSRKSRARMVRTLAQLDWTPMYVAGLPSAMVTLTYSRLWEVVAPTGADVKAHLDALLKRWARRWHRCNDGCRWQARQGRFRPAVKRGRRNASCVPCRALRSRCTCGPAYLLRWTLVHAYAEPPCAWKMEFQDRGAPHFHLLVCPPDDPTFPAWLSATWADVVAHPDPEELRRHRLAGTGIDWERGGRCFDPKRAAVYFSKHGGAGGGKEYQHKVPELWQEEGAGPGRFWGYRGMDKAVSAVDVDLVDFLRLRRTLRRWSKQAGMTRKVTVMRVDADGVVTFRTRRRRGIIAQGGLTGGTVLVNDGPAFASALSRLISG